MVGGASQPGSTLLEVLVAMVLVATVGTTVAALTAESFATISAAQDAEAEAIDADRFLRTVSLWPRQDLDRRLGDRRQGEWWMRIDRIERGLYRIGLRHDKGGGEFLWTALYVGPGPDAARADDP